MLTAPPAGESPPDAALLALQPAFESAAAAFLALEDEINAATGLTPEAEEAQAARHRTVWPSLQAVAASVLEHTPETLPGLVLVARASALLFDTAWDEFHPADTDARLTRTVFNALFRLAGVDWRGRVLPSVKPLPAYAADPASRHADTRLVALADRAVIAERAAVARNEVAGKLSGEPPYAFARSDELFAAVAVTPARTLAGLAAKGRLLLERIEDADEVINPACNFLAQTLAEDAARLGGAVAPAAQGPGETVLSTGDDEAVRELVAEIGRCDAACAKLSKRHPGLDCHQTPGYRTVERRRFRLIARLTRTRALGIDGLVAKAQALLMDELVSDHERHGELAVSTARDLTRLLTPVENAPDDPVFAAIGASASALRAFADHDRSVDRGPGAAAVIEESNRLCDLNVDAWLALLATAPKTDAGRRAFAAHAAHWLAENGGVDLAEAVVLLRALAGPQAAPSPAIDPDAELHALAADTLSRTAAVDAASAEKQQLWEDHWSDAAREAAYDGAYARWRTLAEPYEAATEALARMTPTTLAGFVAKAKVAAVEPFLAIHVARELAAFGARASCQDDRTRIVTA